MQTELAIYSADFHRQFLQNTVLVLLMCSPPALLSGARIPVAKFISPNESVRPLLRSSGQPMNRVIEIIEKEQQKDDAKPFSVGDSVRVHTRVVEGDKERIQIFAGVVIGRKGR